MSQSESLLKVRAELRDVLERMSATIGPRLCEHGDFAECEGDCTFDDTRPVDVPVILEEFVLVSQWRKMDDEGEWQAGTHTAPRQPITRTNGLLHTALYEM